MNVAKIASNERRMARDIIVHYDEDTGKLVCSTVDRALTAPLLAGALPLEISVEELERKGADEAEKVFGAGIFALIDIHATKKIGLRDYRTISNNWAILHGQNLTDQDHGTAKYELALQMVAEGLRGKSRAKMEQADRLLRDAVSIGNSQAKEYLQNLWPSLKERSDRTFK